MKLSDLSFYAGIATFVLLLDSGFASAKMTCASVRERTQSKKGKAACELADHTVGLSPGSTITIYRCGKTKYRLEMMANNDCFVTTVK